MYSDLPNRLALNQPHKLVPFGVRQPHGVFVLADADALICNFDLGAMLAFLAEGKFDGFHRLARFDGFGLLFGIVSIARGPFRDIPATPAHQR